LEACARATGERKHRATSSAPPCTWEGEEEEEEEEEEE
jgi:hypothetical protein